MTYLNADRYLWLKQQLVMKRMADLGAAIAISDRPVDGEVYLKGILDCLETIQSDLTVPYAMLENANIYLDLNFAGKEIAGFGEATYQDKEFIDRSPKGPEGLHSLIFTFPDFTVWKDQHAENLKNKNVYDDSRRIAGEMIAGTSIVITSIRKWAEGSKELPLNHVIALVNMVEVAEWIFAFTNATCESKIDDIDNNPTAGC